MSDEQTPTPLEAAREAEEEMLTTLTAYAEIEHPHRDHPALAHKYESDEKYNRELVARLIAAIRAATLEEVRQKVEGLPSVHYTNILGQHVYTVLDRDEVLAALSGAEKTHTKD